MPHPFTYARTRGEVWLPYQYSLSIAHTYLIKFEAKTVRAKTGPAVPAAPALRMIHSQNFIGMYAYTESCSQVLPLLVDNIIFLSPPCPRLWTPADILIWYSCRDYQILEVLHKLGIQCFTSQLSTGKSNTKINRHSLSKCLIRLGCKAKLIYTVTSLAAYCLWVGVKPGPWTDQGLNSWQTVPIIFGPAPGYVWL